MAEKLDFKKKYKDLYNPSKKEISLVTVPAFNFLMVDGAGDPNTSSEFREAMEAIFTSSFTLKFMFKQGKLGRKVPDYGVMPPEGLWWMDDMSQFTNFALTPGAPAPGRKESGEIRETPPASAGGGITVENKSRWKWTIMLMQPDFATAEDVEKAKEAAQKKKPIAALSKLRFEKYDEGLSAQIMFIGPFADEGPTILRIHQFIKEKGLVLRGKHHEIYLSDMRRTAPEKLKTVIRQPAEKA
jgi:hypothetical protein